MTFDLQPTLRGDLLHLRPLRQDDYDALFAVASDPLIWEQHPVPDRYKPEVFEDFFKIAMASGGALAVIDNQTGHIIGSSRYANLKPEKSEIEIGWTFLARAFWGGVYNREMKQLMLRHAFQFVRHVVFLIGPRNLRSRRAMEKIGGTPLETIIDDFGREAVIYRISAGQYPQTINDGQDLMPR
jgi:RimJ/RimL family protein N-acetyltransferase